MNLTDQWLGRIKELFPELRMREIPTGLDSPVAKNWFYKTFGSAAVTYEVGEEDPRELIRKTARVSAQALMEVLLSSLRNN